MSIVAQLALLAVAAVFEVAGDALIRRGLDVRGLLLVFGGVVVLGAYGVLVNLLRIDFSRLLGAYVGWFAVVGAVFGRMVFGNRITGSTAAGLALILAGSLVIQFGPHFVRP